MGTQVVITGIGAVAPTGLRARACFQALVEGRSGIRKLSRIVPGMEVSVGGEVRGLEPVVPRVLPERHLGRFAQLALAAAREAAADADLHAAAYASERIATILGIGMGAVDELESYNAKLSASRDPTRLDTHALDTISPNLCGAIIAAEVEARGPAYCTVSACASSGHAIGEALRLLRGGTVDAVITGGAESGVTPFGISLFERIGALTTWGDAPESASRPFDRDRTGFVIAEGASILVLERLDAARKRGARVYAELAGYGASADAYHVTRPPDDGAGMASAMTRALRDARIDPTEVEYVNAHGTGTPYNDVAETIAIKQVFGEHARRLWISANKSVTGHLLGAAAALELSAVAYGLQDGVVPPTINLDNPDPQCDLDYVPWTARERRIRTVIKNSFGFGGQNSALVIRAV